MLTNNEIKLLKARVAAGNVFWLDQAGAPHKVFSINLRCATNPSDPKHKEPAAILSAKRALPLRLHAITRFVTLAPVVLGDPMGPTTYPQRVAEALAVLCNGKTPPAGYVEAWLLDEHELLQDWAVSNASVCWAQGLGVIDAAVALAESPEEGIGGVGQTGEHQSSEEYFASGEWQPLSKVGQVRPGDALRFKFGSNMMLARGEVLQILSAGAESESVVYRFDGHRSLMFRTNRVLSGQCKHKDVEVQPARRVPGESRIRKIEEEQHGK